MLRLAVLAVCFLTLAPTAAAQTERHADVQLVAPGGDIGELVQRLAGAGVHLDHAVREKTEDGIVVRTVLSESEQAAAVSAGVGVRVLTADLAARARARSLGGCPETAYPVTGSMGCFNTFAEIVATLDAMQAAFPDLVSVKTSLGLTHQEQDVWMVEISDNPGVDEGEPEALFTANHHAREVQSPIVLLYWMWDLLERYGTDPESTFLVNERRLFFIPVLNPDGYVFNETTDPDGGGFWRKNRRANAGGSFGVDLNRNYDYLWGLDNTGSSPDPNSNTYRGPAGFSEPELQALRDFLEDGRDVRVALNYHTYSNLLLYPWGYAAETYTPDHDTFLAMAAAMTAENGYAPGTGPDILYAVNGDSDDWMYGEQETKPKILSFTPEVGSASDGFWPDPSRIEPLAVENLRMNRLAALYAGAAPSVAASSVSYVDGGANGFVDPGDLAYATLTLRNDGQGVSRAPQLLYGVVDGGDPDVFCTTEPFVYDADLAPGESVELTVPLCGVGDGSPLGPAAVTLTVYSDNAPPVRYPVPDLLIGTPEVMVADDASTADGWTGGWGLTADAVSAPTAFTDSPSGDYPNDAELVWELAEPLDLTDESGVTLSFETKWDIENVYDWAEVQVAVADGPWVALAGQFTTAGGGNGVQPEGGPGYDGVQTDWVRETMDLSDAAGEAEVRLRFRLRSDGLVRGDGWLIDDIEISRLVNGFVVDAEATPSGGRLALGAPRPNPTTGAVRLRAFVPGASAVAEVFDVLGRRVATLLDGPVAGERDLVWDGRDGNGARAAPGVYLVRLQAAGAVRTRRVLVTR